MNYALNHLQTRICTVTTICLLLAVLASNAFPTKYFASFAAAAALPLAQATTCATPNLRLSKQLTLDAGAEHSFVTGDFNKDGKQDLVVQTSVGKIYTLLGDGAGNFAQPTVLLLSNGGSFLQMATGDFNGDGRLDLITLGTDRLRIYLGDGGGRFSLGNEF